MFFDGIIKSTMNDLYISRVSIEKKIPENRYYRSIPAVRFVEENGLSFDKPVTFLIGENGMGKSTLIEAVAIAAGFNPEGGTKNFSFNTNDSHSDLHSYLTITRKAYARDGFFLRAESFYNLASNIDELDKGWGSRRLIDSYGGKSLHAQSHGESFLALVKNRFSGEGLYLMDEPEAALSPARLMQLLIRIHDLVEDDSQFIISTHSPILMSYPDADILELNEKGIRRTTYKETDHYMITKNFIEKPERMYRHLFEEEDE